ncbi:hypothetical protein, partial [Fibrobacter intestinalis]|uniref:hypothetical protein n=1 Tax=Fibrobacter intestinalis TaxID=28122 RepID=UPI001C6FCCB1
NYAWRSSRRDDWATTRFVILFHPFYHSKCKQKKTLSRGFRNFLKFLFFGEEITHLKASEERVTAKAQLMTEQKLPSRNST